MNLNVLEVKKLIREKNKTQKAFAKMLDMDAGQLSNTLNGVHQASYPTISRMAEALEVPIQRIILDTQMGDHLNEAVNSRHKVSVSVMSGAMAIFDREFSRYVNHEIDTDDFFVILTKLDKLVGEGVLPTADMLIESREAGGDFDNTGETTGTGKTFKGKLQTRPTENV